MTRVIALTGAERCALPGCCIDCIFWQTQRATSGADTKTRWASAFEEEHGPWGRILLDGDEFLGMLQYGPAAAFPRARTLPAGPPSADGALVTCAFLTDADPCGALERLLLEALADLKSREVATVDAFGIAHVPGNEAGHHTLLDLALLERLGFVPVRSRGPVSLMRLPLGGVERALRPAREAARASFPTAHPA